MWDPPGSADYLPLSHQESPKMFCFLNAHCCLIGTRKDSMLPLSILQRSQKPAFFGWNLSIFECDQLISGFPGGSVVKNLPAKAGDTGLITGLGKSPGEGYGYPLQYSGLENSMDRGAWQATVHGVAKSWTWLSHFHTLCNWIHQSSPLNISYYFKLWKVIIYPKILFYFLLAVLWHDVIGNA